MENIGIILDKLCDKARKTQKTVTTVIPSLYNHSLIDSYSFTVWTVNPKKDGSVEINFFIK